ncbi:MAG: dTDP-4-dehydrorhamnose reductase [Pseudomonadota bacterium]
MSILLFGAHGQVGRSLAAMDGARIKSAVRADADLAVSGAAARLIERTAPAAVINAAAYTKVDAAEDDRAAAHRINAEAVGEIAAAAASIGAAFVHLSTDYVFDGAAATPINETAPTAPLNVYGETKRAGEIAALNAHPDCVILRTSWVYSPYGSNFVKTMLRLSETRDTLNVVGDQIGGPTPARAIAAAALAIADAKCDGASGAGVYHFQGAPAASWADFAEAIFVAANAGTRVDPIPTADYPTPAARPLYTVLDCSRLLTDFGVSQPDWRTDLVETVAALGNSD